MSYQISIALPEDSVVLSQIASAAKSYWGYPQAWLKLWLPDLTLSPEFIAQHDSWKITREDHPIGFIIISSSASGPFEIEHCWISPEYIGQGLGTRLLSQVLSQSRYQGKPFGVLADPNAVPFYQKFGFVTVKEVPGKPEGRTLPWMEMINTPGE
jgi:GNAT superfamily N-acetyltransferase